MHISQIKTKTATILAEADLDNDWYHNNIKRDAQEHVEDGNGEYVYGGQWSRGKTWWTKSYQRKPEKMATYSIDETEKAMIKSTLQFLIDMVEYGPDSESEEHHVEWAKKLIEKLDEKTPEFKETK